MNGDGEQVERRFLFHGEALALAAHVRRPRDYFIDSVASSTLSIAGGRAEARGEGADFGILSYRSAFTRVSGDYDPPGEAVRFTHGNYGENNLPTRTVVEVEVSGFRVNVVQEDEDAVPGFDSREVIIQQAKLLLESTSDRRTPNAYRTITASIRGVMVDGRELIVETNSQMFAERCTKRKLDCAMDDDLFRSRNAQQIIYEGPGVTIGTVVTGLQWADEAPDLTRINKNQLMIKGMGAIHFGEIVIQEGFRRLTLARFELGSPDGGSAVVAQGQSNGTPIPPLQGTG